MNNKSCNSFFMNFANESRLRILMFLLKGRADVTAISKGLRIEQSAVSHNLQRMASCHILDCARKGKNRIYSLNKKTVLPIIKIYSEHIRNNCALRCNK